MRIYTSNKAIALRTKQYAIGIGTGKQGFEIWFDIARIGNIGLTLKRFLLIRYSKPDSKGNRNATGVSIPLW